MSNAGEARFLIYVNHRTAILPLRLAFVLPTHPHYAYRNALRKTHLPRLHGGARTPQQSLCRKDGDLFLLVFGA
jgi:hypothetical protein